MPITEGKYQCKLCDDIFDAKSGEFTRCKCGESEIEPNGFGYSYKNGNRVEVIDQNRYYLENEFVTLPDDIQKTYDEIKKIKEANGYKYYMYEMTQRGKSDERFLSSIRIEYSESLSTYSVESNAIKFSLSLEKKDYPGDEKARERLQRLLTIMKQIELKEFDVSKRRDMIKFAEDHDISYDKEPTGEVDYTFYI